MRNNPPSRSYCLIRNIYSSTIIYLSLKKLCVSRLRINFIKFKSKKNCNNVICGTSWSSGLHTSSVLSRSAVHNCFLEWQPCHFLYCLVTASIAIVVPNIEMNNFICFKHLRLDFSTSGWGQFNNTLQVITRHLTSCN